MSIKREVAILEVYLDRQAELAEPSITETVQSMDWWDLGTIVVLAVIVYGFLLVT